MIDFHSHILPQLDDGAKSVEESLKMLRMLKEQGVNTVALTSHYIAVDESPEAFLSRRQESYNILKDAINNSDEDYPELLLGAEVYYYPGIMKMEELPQLTLEGTNILLLEMPMAQWGEYAIREITDFANFSDIQIVLAHIERYIKYQKKGTIERMLDNGILMQSNASFFYSKKTKRKALKLFDRGYIHFLGSDCHNLEYRPPKISEAIKVIEEKFTHNAIDAFFTEQKEYME